MPRFTLRFIGMSLFVRHPMDAQVDVRFVTHATALPQHMHMSAPEQHIPVLVVSPESWLRTSDDDKFPGRAPGRPIFLSQFDSAVIWRNGHPLPGNVAVSSGGPIVTKPTTVAGWNNFDQLIPKLTDLFPGSAYSPARADLAAPTGKITLTGGTLGTEPPSNPDGEGPWEVVDRKSGAVITTRFISDVVVYSFDFQAGDVIQLNLEDDVVGTTAISFKSDVDINGWVAHDPFLAALSRIRTREILHLHIIGAVVDPSPNPTLLPPTVRLPPLHALLHPDDQSCPPVQGQL